MMDKKKKKTGLGRGIGALIPDFDMDAQKDRGEFFMCPVGNIAPNRYQPRTDFNEEELDRLKDSIAEQGILQPLLVRHLDGTYELIAGERRLRAAKSANLSHVPVVVKNLTDEQVLEVSIIENIQRANLNVLEEAEAYFRLMDEFGYTQEKVAKKIGKNRSTIANLLRLRGLPEKIKQSLLDEEISTGHARALLGAESLETQLALFEQVIAQKLSVRKTELLVNQSKQEKPEPVRNLSATEQAFLENTCSQISSQIQSPVKIRKTGEKGRIEINFTSQSEFSRLVNLLINIS
ncbi:ParB/RepB/Spo0J family partition protein [Desulfotignum balticum]|jgi:ParB family chromosome partitioning protein|uniref:ParB/RepB/Spo0J family partition protein n=1 Tax=Desulfotignum balticum TaxID=115781 RepID=UPI00041215F6|nr:ParB/RepB/Spo0J family partition protein [Desulfotignum balticum]